MKDTIQFYADLAPLYHLIYPNWQASMQRRRDACPSEETEYIPERF